MTLLKNNQTRSRLIMLCGLPGSGKTTLARKLANEMNAIRFNPDEWITELGVDLFDEAMRERLEKRFWQLSKELLTFGQNVILEYGFWSRSEREKKRAEAQALGAIVELRYLDVPFEELLHRLATRNVQNLHGTAPISREQMERYARTFQAPNEAELRLYDGYSNAGN